MKKLLVSSLLLSLTMLYSCSNESELVVTETTLINTESRMMRAGAAAVNYIYFNASELYGSWITDFENYKNTNYDGTLSHPVSAKWKLEGPKTTIDGNSITPFTAYMYNNISTDKGRCEIAKDAFYITKNATLDYKLIGYYRMPANYNNKPNAGGWIIQAMIKRFYNGTDNQAHQLPVIALAVRKNSITAECYDKYTYNAGAYNGRPIVTKLYQGNYNLLTGALFKVEMYVTFSAYASSSKFSLKITDVSNNKVPVNLTNDGKIATYPSVVDQYGKFLTHLDNKTVIIKTGLYAASTNVAYQNATIAVYKMGHKVD